MAYWFNLDTDLVAGDTRTITMTFAGTDGTPTNISAWTFYYKAINKVATGTGTSISVANSAMTKSDSGTGTTDTVSIPLDNSSTASLVAGKYDQEVAVTIATEPTTIARGTLTVYARTTSLS